MTDEALIARVIAADDRAAFAELLQRHQDAVRRLLRRLCVGDAAWADDLAQETFLRVYRGLSGFAGRAKFSSWLYRIAYNVFLNAAELRQPLPLTQDVPAAENTRDPILARTLERAMAELRHEERLALSLSYGQGFTPDEIAGVLQCPEGTVKTHLQRGREKLRALLAENKHE